MHAEMAHGTLVKGSAKCSPASTAPKAEFCMPTCKRQGIVSTCSRLLLS